MTRSELIRVVRHALILCVGSTAMLGAQVVRGTVTERPEGTGLPGVVLTLERTDSGLVRVVASALSDNQGNYAVRGSAPGRYRVSAKRIGVQRFIGDDFELGAGETRRVDIALDHVAYALPEVSVLSAQMCLTRPGQLQQVSGLWDEVQTALAATQISLRDSLFTGRVTRYVRELDPRSFKVLNESRAQEAGALALFHSAISAESLSTVGYWWKVPGEDAQIFNGPDADILASPSFLRDHCFEAVTGTRARKGLVGLAFAPKPERRVGDIRGTLWLDARTFELKLVEFYFTRLSIADSANIGGEVHFARLPNGAWIVRRWFLRIPRLAHATSSPLSTTSRVPMLLIMPTVFELVEDGGDVFAEGLRLFSNPAVVMGVVEDTAGRPLPGATIRLDGTPFRTQTDSRGTFRLDSLPAGRHSLVVEQADYAALGTALDTRPLTMEEGDTVRLVVRAPKSDVILARLCAGKRVSSRQAALRLTLVDMTTNQPVSAVGVFARWTIPTATKTPNYDGVEARSDLKGVALFCGVPASLPLELYEVETDGRLGVHLADVTLGEHTAVARVLRIRHSGGPAN